MAAASVEAVAQVDRGEVAGEVVPSTWGSDSGSRFVEAPPGGRGRVLLGKFTSFFL